jgi:hypothetical protein
VPPALGAAVALALRAVRREAWLLAPGFLVTALRRALAWPALAFGWAVAAEAAYQAARTRPLDPLAPLAGVAAAATSPRVVAIIVGLSLAAAVGGGLLRVAWLAGALPTLGGALSGTAGGADRFAAGVARELPRLLATAALALAARTAGALFALALGLGALRISVAAAGGAPSPLLAAAVALALTLALVVPLGISAASDAALARTALCGEGPARAFAGAARRLLLRPGAFLLGAIAFGGLGALAPASAHSLGNAMTGLAAAASPAAMVGPALLLAALAAGVATALELAWLGTVATLACGEERPS